MHYMVEVLYVINFRMNDSIKGWKFARNICIIAVAIE